MSEKLKKEERDKSKCGRGCMRRKRGERKQDKEQEKRD